MGQIKFYLEGDSIQRERAITRICKEVFPGQEVERKIYKADQGQIPKAIEELFSFSLFDDVKVIILTGIEKLVARKKKSDDNDEGEESASGAKALQPLLEVIANPRGDTPFLLFSEVKTSIPKKFLDTLGKERIVTLPKTSVGEIRKAIENKCAKAGFTLSKPAMDFFMETCGKDVDAAQQEFKKIELWAEQGKEIDLEICRRLIWGETESNIWAVSDGILEKNPTKALNALQKLFAEGEEGYSIAGTLIFTFRNFHTYMSLLQEKIPSNEWKNYASLAPFVLSKCKTAAQRLTLESTQAAFSLMCQADADLKGGKSEPKLVIERLVLDLCRI